LPKAQDIQLSLAEEGNHPRGAAAETLKKLKRGFVDPKRIVIPEGRLENMLKDDWRKGTLRKAVFVRNCKKRFERRKLKGRGFGEQMCSRFLKMIVLVLVLAVKGRCVTGPKNGINAMELPASTDRAASFHWRSDFTPCRPHKKRVHKMAF
jgi:hypothetical protein